MGDSQENAKRATPTDADRAAKRPRNVDGAESPKPALQPENLDAATDNRTLKDPSNAEAAGGSPGTTPEITQQTGSPAPAREHGIPVNPGGNVEATQGSPGIIPAATQQSENPTRSPGHSAPLEKSSPEVPDILVSDGSDDDCDENGDLFYKNATTKWPQKVKRKVAPFLG